MNEARHHHYLSQCYLRGFTKNGGVKSKLTALDIKKKKAFETSTRNVGGIRDFNRLDIEGFDPNILESSLAEFEGSVATELKKLSQGAPFSGNTKDTIISFISLLAVRTPAMREHMTSQITPIIEMIARMSIATQERYENAISEIENSTGNAIASNVSYETVRDFVESGNYNISLKREFLIAAEIQVSKAIEEALDRRSWRMFRSTLTSGSFVTTDNPVHLMWNDDREGVPDFGLLDTSVLFPVSKDLILLGDYNGVEGVFDTDDKLAAYFNSKSIFHAVERVFSSDLTFNYIDANGDVKQGKKLI
ncbi:hypothetical protein ABI58_11025 [Salmonella enterica subsp. enterica serovar Salford]|nr:DUF4238 domain-containing protein [Salmonella enterica subsp. enterica serovar Salford]KSU41685.1 hypothetical protein ABI58_11025 [Salmonella enterica subsp. enterica serovar Salford]HBJ6779602.1 DUF4238 domain-containing protein [Salmonella enterica subsp. enterica serovar Salford]